MYLLMIDGVEETLETFELMPTEDQIKESINHAIDEGLVTSDHGDVEAMVYGTVKYYSASRSLTLEEVKGYDNTSGDESVSPRGEG